ncbi:MAG: DUF1254 domain-containing protein [Pseudomonadota bacterium]
MSLLKWCIPIVLCAWLGQYLLAMWVPSLIMEVLYYQAGKQNGYNQLFISPIPDATARNVVRPSPDLLYAICVYDLSEGPIAIEALVPARYWSMQFYQMNTDNFAAITNQRDEQALVDSVLQVTLIGSADSAEAYEGEVIQSPSDRGVMLLRASAIGDYSESLEALESSRCGQA